MSLALAYDSVLSRVRLSGPVPGLLDTCLRSVSNGWGTSDSGHTWAINGNAANFSVSGGLARHSLDSINVSRWSTIPLAVADFDFSATMATDALAVGGSHFLHLGGRFADTNNTYLARIEFTTGQAVALTIRKRVAGTETQIAGGTIAGLTHAANTRVAVRFQVAGSTLRAKAWLAANPEPAGWTVSTTDTALTAAGAIGIRSILSATNTNPLPVLATYDDVTSRGTAVAQRSTNTITWTTVRGGTALPGDGDDQLRLDDYEFAADVLNTYRVRVVEPDSGALLFSDTGTITPALGEVWLKSIARPFLNRPIVVQDFSDVTRPARSGVFPVVGRPLPVAVNDLRGSKQWTLSVLTQTLAEARDFDLVLASGDPLFVHVPADCAVPGGYVTVGDTTEARTARRSLRRLFALPCTEVVAPGPDVVGVTYTCAGVLNDYATCADVIAANATCADLLEHIGDAEDVIVP